MKVALMILLVAAFLECPARAQTFNLSTNNALWTTTNASVQQSGSKLDLRGSGAFGLRLGEPRDTNSVGYALGSSKVRLSGPLATTLGAKSPGDFGHRVLRLFSPFSSARQNLPPGAEVSGPVSTRAWSTLVGWSPGRSAFPDEQHHDPPALRLLSVNVEQQP